MTTLITEPEIVPAPTLHAGDEIEVHLPGPSLFRRLLLALQRRPAVQDFPAVVRQIAMSPYGGLAECESTELPGLFVQVDFLNSDLVRRFKAAGIVA